MGPDRGWLQFAGASLALMGASLAGAASARAEEMRSWQRQWRQSRGASGVESGARWEWGYRAAGALMIVAGAALGWAADARRLPVWSPAHPRAAGLLIGLSGGGLAALRLSSRSSRGPVFLPREPAPRRPWNERLADAAGWGLCALWIGYGWSLLRSAR